MIDNSSSGTATFDANGDAIPVLYRIFKENAGKYTVWYYAAATGTHTQSETFQITVEIDKANYNVVPPTAQAPVYDGNPHTLISAGSSKYGKMNYKIDGGSWGQALPSADRKSVV